MQIMKEIEHKIRKLKKGNNKNYKEKSGKLC